MRIAFVCTDPGVPVFGCKGCSVHVQEVVRAFRNTGAQVELFASRLGGKPPPDLNGVPVLQLPHVRCADVREREIRLVRANLPLATRLSEREPFDLVYERYSLWSYSAMEFARRAGVTGTLEVNAPLLLEQQSHRKLVNQVAARTLSRRCFDAAQHINTVSDEVSDYVRQEVSGSFKVNTIPNGVNTSRFEPNSTYRARSGRPIVIGFIGSLKPWHGLTTLLEAFSILHQHHPSTILSIVGDGPERSELLRKLALLPEHVQAAIECHGAVPPAEIPQVLRGFDIGVAPYPAIDQFYFSPLKVLEYMAAGLPVVASRIGQIRSLVEDHQHGLLCQPGCPHSLVEALGRLIENPSLRQRLGRSARHQVELHHSWDSVVSQILHAVSSRRVFERSPS